MDIATCPGGSPQDIVDVAIHGDSVYVAADCTNAWYIYQRPLEPTVIEVSGEPEGLQQRILASANYAQAEIISLAIDSRDEDMPVLYFVQRTSGMPDRNIYQMPIPPWPVKIN